MVHYRNKFIYPGELLDLVEVIFSGLIYERTAIVASNFFLFRI